jgi:hypothetical protein
MAGTMQQQQQHQRHALGRLVLEIETLVGEIRSLRRRDRGTLTPDARKRLDEQIERKQARLREMQSRAAQSVSSGA